MHIHSKREIITLFLGDIVSFLLALWATLLVRNLAWPTWDNLLNHLAPFSIIFIVWIIVFFITDLYGKQTSLFQKRLPSTLFNAQLINTMLAVVFFYFIPYFGITPKITLFIDLILSFAFILVWRRYLTKYFYRGRREAMLFLCSGKEIDELAEEFRSNKKYNIKVVDASSRSDLRKVGASIVVTNAYDEGTARDALEEYYSMIFSGVRFINAHVLYEEVFERIPVGIIDERWFLENISNRPKPFYDFLKRVFDVVVALILGIISLVIYPFVWLAIKLDDGGPAFFSQERVGKNNQTFNIYKFRSMTTDQKRVTRVGKFLRQSRIDELPQLWSIVAGEQSLVGPRPERPDYAEEYRKAISFYDIRHIISPGLSGWAQIYHENHPHFNLGLEQTVEKLSYDLYYIKNRSLWLDIKIALKTLNTLLRRTGI